MPRVMEITTPLNDVLLFHGMHAREELGRLSDYRVGLLSHPDQGDVELDKILGQNVTVKLELREGTRYFNGYVTRFAQAGKHGRYNRYIASVQPWTWFLTRTADCRIFQDMTVPDIVKAVFAEHTTADFKLELTNPYRKWTYCVQYRETDFNFVSRLMEHEGIFYYFRHTDGHHTLVLTDSTTKMTAEAGCETIKFFSPEQFVRPEVEYINSWDFSREVQPGKFVHTDYNFETPSANIQTQKLLPRNYGLSDYEIYDYPGFYMRKRDGEQYASVRIDEFGSQFETAQGACNVRGLKVGSLFTLDGCPRADQNREHVIIAATYDLSFSDYEAMPDQTPVSYQCSFVAMSSAQQFRPKRATPKPFVQGPQTAVVVGPAGDEIYTDQYGRVKVQFFWDRLGRKDQSSSCWIRVSHPWAGKGWGSVSTPRIGQEVIVDFLEGDPDQPIITGRVYNAESQPPFGFPAGAVLSGIKSQTHKGGGYNELSMDDTAGKEKITIHGQYDMNSTIEHDQTLTVHNNRTDRIDVDDSESVGNNQKWDVGNNRDAKIGANETLKVGGNRTKNVTGNETVTIDGDRQATVSGSETVTVTLQRTHNVGINETISIGAAQEVTVGGLQTISVGAIQNVSIGANQSTDVGRNLSASAGGKVEQKAGKDFAISAGAKFAAQAKSDFSAGAGGTMSLKSTKDFSAQSDAKSLLGAKDELVLQCGSAKIIMKKDGTIEIEGKDITLNGSGKIVATAGGDMNLKGSKINQNS